MEAVFLGKLDTAQLDIPPTTLGPSFLVTKHPAMLKTLANNKIR